MNASKDIGEPAALGCEMNWGDIATYPSCISHPWARAEDAIVPVDLLDREPIRTYLQAMRLAKHRYGQRVALLGKVMGPLSMTQAMRGVQEAMTGLLDEPELAEHFLNVAVRVLVTCANALFEAGADAVAIGEGGAGANMLSPRLYERVLLDVHRRMVGAIQGPTIMHICGDITPRLDMLARLGLACFNFDWAIPPDMIKARAGGALHLMGNINTTDLLLGTAQEIEHQVIANLDAGIDIISPGCAVSPKCPNANFQAMVSTVQRWHARK